MNLDEIEGRTSNQKEEQQRERGKHEQGGHEGQEAPTRAPKEVCGEADDKQRSSEGV